MSDTFKLSAYFKFKMAAKTYKLRISPISANIWVKNMCETPRYMLLVSGYNKHISGHFKLVR